MEICRWKDQFRVPEDGDRPIRFVEKHIIVDAKVRVIRVLVLASNLNDSPVRQKGDRLAKAFRAPDCWVELVITKQPAHVGATYSGANHLLPKRLLDPLRILGSKAPR